jgi:ankyrin repeat protein
MAGLLLHAAGAGELAHVVWLLTIGGASITESDTDGTALLHAAENGQLEVVKWYSD